MSLNQSTLRRENLRLVGGPAEPVVSAQVIADAISAHEVEAFRPLHPVGYESSAEAYRRAARELTADGLSKHYRDGLAWFHEEFVPHLKARLWFLSGGAWTLGDYDAYACGSDVDFMTHIVNAANTASGSVVYPGDWYGFSAGAIHPASISHSLHSAGRLACLCVPSVRNGHLTTDMVRFLAEADSCLLNINLFPTLAAEERHEIASALNPVLAKSVISVSFSRGFGLTASQLGVILIHRDHPLRKVYQGQWTWLTYFYNAIAARAFMALDVNRLMAVDEVRRHWVEKELERRALPIVGSGSYYVKAFVLEGTMPLHLEPLLRDGVVRLCFKPPQV